MIEELYDFLYEVLMWSISSLGIGLTMTISLYGVLDALGLDYNNHKSGKVLCWGYVSLFIFGLCILFYVFF